MLIDIYGGSSSKEVEEKLATLSQGIQRIQQVLGHGKLDNLPAEWKGVVLAPLFADAAKSRKPMVKLISGEDALCFLGGLRQMAYAVDALPEGADLVTGPPA